MPKVRAAATYVAFVICVHLVGCAARANGSTSAWKPSQNSGVPAVTSEKSHDDAGAASIPDTGALAQPAPAAPLSRIPSWYRHKDPLSTFYFHPQTPPKGYRPLPQRISKPYFPGQEFAEVWGYEFGASLRSSNCVTLAQNGTLCPHVVYPGRRLDESQVGQLMSIAHHPLDAQSTELPGGEHQTARRPKMRCGDEPVAMFVFYDAGHRPVGVVGVDEECSQWSLKPAPKDAWEGFAPTTDTEKRVLSELCLGLDLLTCAHLPLDANQSNEDGTALPEALPAKVAVQTVQRALLPLLLRDWPLVDEAKILAAVTDAEREQLCAWYVRSAAIAYSLLFSDYPRWWLDGSGLRDDELHASLHLEGFEECVDKFPRCGGSVGKARACISLHFEHFWDRSETCHTDCVWGIQ